MRLAAALLAIAIGSTAMTDATAAPWSTCRLTDIRIDIPAAAATKQRAELSAVVARGDQLFLLSNEALDKDERQHMVQVFRGRPETGYTFVRDVLLLDADGKCSEADFEALTASGDTFFAITSHARDRKKISANRTLAENLDRLSADGINACGTRHSLHRFTLTGAAAVADVEPPVSLRKLIENHPVLAPFAALPAKENGVDIEGLVAVRDRLLVGFRGPVLRHNLVPILDIPQALSTIGADSIRTLFVDLLGRGVRDMAAGPGDTIDILAGPNGDEPQPYLVIAWNGRTQLPGKDRPASDPVLPPDVRCQLPAVVDARGEHKPEGLAYLDTTADGDRYIVVFDGKPPLTAKLLVLPKR